MTDLEERQSILNAKSGLLHFARVNLLEDKIERGPLTDAKNYMLESGLLERIDGGRLRITKRSIDILESYEKQLRELDVIREAEEVLSR